MKGNVKMKKDISFIKNQKPYKHIIEGDEDACEMVFYYSTMRIYIDSDGYIGIIIYGMNHNKNEFDNSYCFDDVPDDYYMDLFNMPKQNDEISKQNEKSLKYIFKRFFGG